MASVALTRRALDDLERLFTFIAPREDPAAAEHQVDSVRRALALLGEHPLLGRPAESGRRELVLSRGRYGYVAKYRWFPSDDAILVLTVRHQREAGYPDE